MEDILIQLEQLSNPTRKKIIAKHVKGDNYFGVAMKDLRNLAKEIGINQDLALQLWSTGNIDAMMLAISIFDSSQLDKNILEKLVSDLNYYIVCDELTNHLIIKSKMINIYEEWYRSGNLYQERIAWKIMAYLASEKSLDKLDYYLDLIEEEMLNTEFLIQEMMNMTLVYIAVYNEEYYKRCINIAEKLGLYKNQVVAKGCTNAYAINWINALMKRQQK